MSDNTVTVTDHTDISEAHDGMTVQDVEAALAALESGWEVVAFVPDWLLEDKDCVPRDVNSNVVVGHVEHETERAWLVSDHEGRDGWLPKSVAVRFEAGSEAHLTSPQQRLGARWGGGE